MPDLLLASNNAKKLAELQRILAPPAPDVRVLGLGDVSAYDEPVEGRRHVCRQCDQGPCWSGANGVADRGRRLGSVRRCAQRHAGRVERALVGPAEKRRAQQRTAARPTRRRAGRASRRSLRVRDRRVLSWRHRVGRRGPDGRSDHPRDSGAGASATTCSSWPATPTPLTGPGVRRPNSPLPRRTRSHIAAGRFEHWL